MGRRVRVHQFLVTEHTRPRSPTWRASDLFGVSHWIDIPADTEFPFTVSRMQLFARFYLSGANPVPFRVRVVWLNAPDKVSRVVGDYGPFVVPFAPDAAIRDCSFNLHHLRLQGVGLHRVELVRSRRTEWGPRKLVQVAKTYLEVER